MFKTTENIEEDLKFFNSKLFENPYSYELLL